MIFGLPLAVIFGILTIISLFTTASLGIATHVYKKNVFKFHMFFAFTTLTLALIHLILVFMWLYLGITY